MTKITPPQTIETNSSKIAGLANQVSRSTIAVIDAITQRGGFRGEELLTIGTLREQAVQLVQLYEAEQRDQAGE